MDLFNQLVTAASSPREGSNMQCLPLSSVPLPMVLLAVLMVPVRAQDAAGNLEVVEVKGTLKAAVGYQLQIADEKDKPVMIVMDPRQSKVFYSGSADPRFLAPGQFVRFTAPFNQAAVPQAPVSSIEIFNVVKLSRMKADEIRAQTPGVYPATEEKEDGKGPKSKKNEPTKIPAAPAGSQNYFIVGRIMGLQGDKLQVAAGNQPLVVTLSPSLAITVASRDTTFCMPGDTVVVSGLANAGAENFVQAETITITGANPLGKMPEQPDGSRRQRRTRADKNSDSKDGAQKSQKSGTGGLGEREKPKAPR